MRTFALFPLWVFLFIILIFNELFVFKRVETFIIPFLITQFINTYLHRTGI